MGLDRKGKGLNLAVGTSLTYKLLIAGYPYPESGI